MFRLIYLIKDDHKEASHDLTNQNFDVFSVFLPNIAFGCYYPYFELLALCFQAVFRFLKVDYATDSEDELPEGWEARVTIDGRVYYANHKEKVTQWEHPITRNVRSVSGELPHGWERKVMDDGNVIYVDHIRQKTSFTDPRLAFAKIQKSDAFSFKKFYVDTSATAKQFLNDRDLTNQTAIITGANRGLGLELARSLSFAGCYVILACRNLESAEKACEQLRKERPYVNVEVMELDLCSLKSVKYFVDKFKTKKIQLNTLYLNAAVFEPSYTLTDNGLELMFQVNFLAQFYLTRLLIDCLMSASKSRIVVISCESHRGTNLNRKDISSSKLNAPSSEFSLMQTYCNTKLCSILFANELNRRLVKLSSDLKCYSCHPGNLLPTNLFNKYTPIRIIRPLVSVFTKSMQQAAATPVFCGVSRDLDTLDGGIYWNSVSQCVPSPEAQDGILGYRIWEISESILISKTKAFDGTLSAGDRFSSVTAESLPNENE